VVRDLRHPSGVHRWRRNARYSGTVLGKRQLNGRLKRQGNGNYGHCSFRCLNRFRRSRCPPVFVVRSSPFPAVGKTGHPSTAVSAALPALPPASAHFRNGASLAPPPAQSRGMPEESDSYCPIATRRRCVSMRTAIRSDSTERHAIPSAAPTQG